MFDSDELGLPRVKFQTEPHDTAEDKERGLAEFKQARADVAELRQRLAGPSARASAIKPGKPLGEAVDEFLKEGVKKPKTFRAYRTALKLRAIPFFGADTPVSSIDLFC